MSERRINVTVTEYDGDQEFSEASSYPEFVASELSTLYKLPVEVTTGLSVRVFLYGFEGDDAAANQIERDVATLVKVDLWDQFCESGYKQFTEVQS